MNKSYVFLIVAILSEVVGTSCLKASEGFTRLWPSVFTIVGYLVAFACLAQTLRTIPTGVAYAIWSGVGIVLISLVGWIVFGQKLNAPTVAGMVLIMAGVVVVNLFSNSHEM
jgi:small multidrug resistance pump